MNKFPWVRWLLIFGSLSIIWGVGWIVVWQHTHPWIPETGLSDVNPQIPILARLIVLMGLTMIIVAIGAWVRRKISFRKSSKSSLA